jgi:autotransporter-associated beta strand protein
MTVERSSIHVAAPRNLVLIDARVPEPKLLLAALVEPCRVVWVPRVADGLGALRRALKDGGGPPRSVHVISHGAPGRLLLGRGRVDAATVRQRVVELAEIRRALAGAPVAVYGCSVGAGESGREFVSALAAAFGGRVIASSTPTGAAACGGDWILDVGAGDAFDAPTPGAVVPVVARARAAAWPGLLVDITTTAGDTSAGSLGLAAQSSNATYNFVDLSGTITLASAITPPNPGSSITWTYGGSTTALTIVGAAVSTTNVGMTADIGAGNTLTIDSDITGGNSFQVNSGTLVLSGMSTGSLEVTGTGTLSVASNGSLGNTVTLNGGTLEVTGAVTISRNIVLGSSNGTISTTADVTFSGVVSGSGTLTKTGTNTVTLSGTNTHSGNITVSAGTLNMASGNALSDTGIVNVAAGANLDLNGATATIGALTGSGAVNVGGGAMTLSNAGASSFSGTINGTGTFAVASGATLGGTSTFTIPVTIASGGTIAPGNSPGTISTSNLTLASGSTASMEINGTTAGTQYDQIVVTGTVNVSGATLSPSFGYTSSTGQSYILIDNDGADAVTGTFSGLAEGASFTANGRTYQISYAGSTGNDIVLTDVGQATFSTSTATSIFGTDGDNRLFGTNSTDLIQAGQGADVVYALDGADSLSGGTGADDVHGHGGIDLIYGNQGSDVLYGNQGADTMFGGQDADTVFGGQDADVIYGNLGDDIVYGNYGSDILYGGAGDDTLFGGQGVDWIYTGSGADKVVVGDAGATDVIVDFDVAGGDRLLIKTNINGQMISTGAELVARASDNAHGDAEIDLGGGYLVRLIGVKSSELTADYFELY